MEKRVVPVRPCPALACPLIFFPSGGRPSDRAGVLAPTANLSPNKALCSNSSTFHSSGVLSLSSLLLYSILVFPIVRRHEAKPRVPFLLAFHLGLSAEYVSAQTLSRPSHSTSFFSAKSLFRFFETLLCLIQVPSIIRKGENLRRERETDREPRGKIKHRGPLYVVFRTSFTSLCSVFTRGGTPTPSDSLVPPILRPT